jgi:hypothetical protein
LAMVAVQGCATSSMPPPMDPQVACFLQLIAKVNDFVDQDQVIWYVVTDPEYRLPDGWAAEIRGDTLQVVELEFDARDCSILQQRRGVYTEISANRAAAIYRVFNATTAPGPPAEDWWSGTNPVKGYAGLGNRSFETLYLASGMEVKQVCEWLSDDFRQFSPDEHLIVPIELGLPWLISRYYRATSPDP